MSRIQRKFFLEPTIDVAKNLLGKILVHKYRGRILKGMIMETEAYLGTKDKACHSYDGKRTGRTNIMYEKGGKAYPYFVYGMHWLFNITAGKENEPEAVLIRGLDVAQGPAVLTKFLKLDGNVYGCDLCKKESRIFVEDTGIKIKKSDISVFPRVGIDYAGPYWSLRKLRFVLTHK